MQITIINDCADENAKLRQVSRAGSLIENSSVSCFGVRSDLEAAGFLVDALDSFEGRPGIILANVAPRNGRAKKWANGAPFGFFRHAETLVVSSADGLVLSLVKKLGILEEFHILDIPEVLALADGGLDAKTKERITKSQFRSFDFLPRAADWICKNKKIPFSNYPIDEIADAPSAVWFIDNFGNVKTVLLAEELGIAAGQNEIVFLIGEKEHRLNFYERLKDLPNDSAGLVVGSSGIGEKRFLEIMFQGGSAAEKLGIKSGSSIKIIRNR